MAASEVGSTSERERLNQIARLHPLDRKAAIERGEVSKLDIWTLRVFSSVMGPDADRETIARMCLEAEERGENCAVWHQSSVFYGHQCNCFPCSQQRKAA